MRAATGRGRGRVLAAELRGEIAEALDDLADVAPARVAVEVRAAESLGLLDVALLGRGEPQAVAGELRLGVIRRALDAAERWNG